MKIRRIDHVGINVDDLPAAKAFFLDLGLEVLGEQDVEGEWVDLIIGLRGVRSSVVMMGTPEGGANIELVKFHTPADEKGIQRPSANTLGMRHITFVVEDIEATVARLEKRGAELVGEIVIYKDSYELCYLRGPEGMILELVQELD